MQENNVQEAKNLTQGNVLSTLLKFAVPVLLAMILQALYGGVDLLVVGQFGTTQDVSGGFYRKYAFAHINKFDYWSYNGRYCFCWSKNW